MGCARVRTQIIEAVLATALSTFLALSQAQAAVTYSFWLESATDVYWNAPASDSDLLYTRAKISTLHVTLDHPEEGGSLDFNFDSGGSPLASDDPECALNCIISYSATGISIGATDYWHGFASFDPPVCDYLYCELGADLEHRGHGLEGSFLLGSTNDTLQLSGTGDAWTGWWGSDGPGSTIPLILVGHWREVPLPGTLVLLGSGAIGLCLVRWRKKCCRCCRG